MPPNITLIAVAGEMPGAEPAGKRLAGHARKLALEPNLQIVHHDVVDHCCEAWNKLVDQPGRASCRSVFADWAHRGRDQRVSQVVASRYQTVDKGSRVHAEGLLEGPHARHQGIEGG